MLTLLSISSFTYFLFNFKIKKIQGSITLNTLASSVSEVVAKLLCLFIYQKVGPRKSYGISYMVASAGTMLLLCFPDSIDFIPLFVTISKFGICISFNTGFLASVDLVPTIFSASVFGFCNFAARFLTILSSEIAEQDYPTPMLICVLSVVAGVFISSAIITDLPRFLWLKYILKIIVNR